MSKGGAVVRALASHQCGPGSNPGVNTTCGLSLLCILSFAQKGFFVVLQFSPLLKNQHFQIPLTLKGFCTHPVMHRSRHSHSESFILLQTSLSSVNLSFFSRTIIQWNNLPASVFSEHCSLDTFKAHESCLNHLAVY